MFESELWKVSKKEKSPLKELLIGKYARDFWQAFVLSTGIWMGFLTIVSSLPTISMKVVGISPVTFTLYVGIAALIWGACFYHWGLLSQK